MNKFTDFTALAAFLEEARDHGIDTSNEYASSFIEESEMAKLSVVSEPEKVDMPDPFQVEAAVDLMMRTMFDVLRDTRMEEFAKDLVWGFCNSFHMVAKRLEGREDDAARKLGELARTFDPRRSTRTNSRTRSCSARPSRDAGLRWSACATTPPRSTASKRVSRSPP
jgi:hypothetical protein